MNNTIIPRDVLLYLSTFLDPYTGNSLRLTCKFLHNTLAHTYEKPIRFEAINSSRPLLGYIFNIEIVSKKIFISIYFYVFDSPEKTIYKNDQLALITEIHHIKSEKFATLIYSTAENSINFLITLPQMHSIINIARQIYDNNTVPNENVKYYLRKPTLQDITFERLFY